MTEIGPLTVQIGSRRRWWVGGAFVLVGILVTLADRLAALIVEHGYKITID